MTTPGIDPQAAAAAAAQPITDEPGAPAGAPVLVQAEQPAAAAAAAAAQLEKFYDSTRPWLIPAGTSRAALYFDGLYGASGRHFAATGKIPNTRFITITGDAFHCGIADYERLNPVFEQPGILRDWAVWRIDHQHRARVYVQRSLASRALAELGPVARDPRCLFWIPTLDNEEHTAEDLAAELARQWNAPIPASQIWACQNVGGNTTWDRSDLFGVW